MFSDFEESTAELFKDFGVTANNAVLVKASQSDYDPAVGSVVETTVEIGVRAILLDLTLQSNGLSLKYGTQIIAGDKEAYVLPNIAAPFTITPNDIFRMAGNAYKVVTFKEVLNPANQTVIVYSLYLRR